MQLVRKSSISFNIEKSINPLTFKNVSHIMLLYMFLGYFVLCRALFAFNISVDSRSYPDHQ